VLRVVFAGAAARGSTAAVVEAVGRAVAAAASSDARPDRAPAEVALLGVCCAVLVAAAWVVVRRALAGGRRPGRGLLNAALAARAAAAEPEDVATAAGAAEPEDVATAAGAAEPEDVATAAGAAEPEDVKSTGEPDEVKSTAGPDEVKSTAGPDDDVDGTDGAGSRVWRPRVRLLVPAAAAILLAGAVGTAVVLLGNDHGATSKGRVVAAPAGQAPGLAAGAGGPGVTSPASGKHPGHGSSHGAAPAASPGPGQSPGRGGAAAGGGSGSGSSGSSTPSTPPPNSAPPATLVLPSGPVTLVGAPVTPVSRLPSWSGDFTISAVNGPVSYTFAEPGAVATYYSVGIYNQSTAVTAMNGTVQPGQPLTLEVELAAILPEATAPPAYVTVTYTGQANPVTIEFTLTSSTTPP
jgi:hypothetical protein